MLCTCMHVYGEASQWRSVTDCPFEVDTCSGHVYMERLLNDVIIVH